MQQPTWEEALSLGSLRRAWDRVKRNKGAPGVNGQTIPSFAHHLDEHIQDLQGEICGGTYQPLPLRSVPIPKRTPGTWRYLAIPTVRDRVLQQSLSALLIHRFDPLFLPCSFAYRPGRSTADAVEALREHVAQGAVWYLKGDIRGCFDEIDWELLSRRLQVLQDPLLRRLVNQAIRSPLWRDGALHPRSRGVPQGGPLSPFLSNLFLHSFDHDLTRLGFRLIRFADDWVICASSPGELRDAYRVVLSVLGTLKVRIQTEKTRQGDLRSEPVQFLGFRIDAHGADADLRGWRRFQDAARRYRTASNLEEWIRARADLRSLQAYYRGCGNTGP